MINVEIYTDGACKGNPGPGGFGWVMLIKDRETNKVIEKFYRAYGVKQTTNNRMELNAVIDSLEHLELYLVEKYGTQDPTVKMYKTTVYSDSAYVCNAFNKGWINKWSQENFNKIKNPDLWKAIISVNTQLLNANSGSFYLNFNWVKGHNGEEYNEEADQLASFACGEEGVVMEHYIKLK